VCVCTSYWYMTVVCEEKKDGKVARKAYPKQEKGEVSLKAPQKTEQKAL